MVYLTRWEDFETAAMELYKRSAIKTRYCVKFRPKDGELILKITDNYKCIKFKTKSSIILNRFEALNLRLLLSMSATKSQQPSSSTTATVSTEPPAGPAVTTSVPAGERKTEDIVMKEQNPTEGTPGKSTGGKKKKKGKK